MKKKVIALVVTACLCLTLAIPAAGTWASMLDEPEQETDISERADEMTASVPAADETEEPVLQAEAPAEPAETEEPAAEEEEPAAEAEEPAAEEEKPVAEAEEPGTEIEEPAEEKPAMTAVMKKADLYAVRGSQTTVILSVNGGSAPYGVVCCGETYEMLSAGEIEITVPVTEGGDMKIAAVITDAEGSTCEANTVIPVAVSDKGCGYAYIEAVEELREELSGDAHEDLVMMAFAQVGCRQSGYDFIIENTEDGRQYFSRYGNMFGMPYGEWSAAFVCACAEFALLPERLFPEPKELEDWIDEIREYNALEKDPLTYEAVPGDIVFLRYDGMYHAGIVESADSDLIRIIEANRYGSVQETEYETTDTRIVAYGSLWKLMDHAGMLPAVEIECNVVGANAYTNTDRVNMRADAGVTSDVVVNIEDAYAPLKILGAKKSGTVVWYHVAYGDVTGYIRSDLMEIGVYGAEAAEDALTVADVDVFAEPELNCQPVQMGDTEAAVSFVVSGAVSFSWQRGHMTDGEKVWEEILVTDDSAAVLPVDFGALAFSYRCVATTQDNGQIISDEFTLMDVQLVQWMNETDVTEEMLARAMNAKSLDSMVIEDGRVFYVRTGEAFARIDADTGYMIDENTGLVIAVVDRENGLIYPIGADELPQ